jgi:exosortase/archaeosortase family protein
MSSSALVTIKPASGDRQNLIAVPSWLSAGWLVLLVVQFICAVDFKIEPHARAIPAAVSVVFLLLGIFRKLENRPELSFQLRAPGVFVVFLLSLLQVLAIIFHMTFARSIVLFLTIGVLLWTLLGRRGLRHFLPVLLFAAFAFTKTPEEVTQYLTIPLQHLSAHAVVAVLKPFVPITGKGHLFTVNGHKFDVAPSCSGLNQWVALSYFFLLSAMFIRYKIIGFVVGLSADPVITLGMNVIRLTITALVAYVSTVENALAIHTNIEFLIFPFGVAALWLGLRRFKIDAS